MASDLVSLVDDSTIIKVSSTLDKSVGKKNLVDGNAETCWTSQQGLPQSIQLRFSNLVIPRRLSLTFQGGFVGTSVKVSVSVDPTNEWQPFVNIYPEDVNRRQIFDFPATDLETDSKGIQAIKFIFEESSDFFGRIIIYDLTLEGIVIPTAEAHPNANG